jgi:hypothetical protein
MTFVLMQPEGALIDAFCCLQNAFASTCNMAPISDSTDALTEASPHEGTSDARGRFAEDLPDVAAHDSSTLGTDVHGTSPATGVCASMEDTAGTQLTCTHDDENEASSDDDSSEGASSDDGRSDEDRAEEDVERIHRLCARFDAMGQKLMDLECKLVPLGYEVLVDCCMYSALMLTRVSKVFFISFYVRRITLLCIVVFCCIASIIWHMRIGDCVCRQNQLPPIPWLDRTRRHLYQRRNKQQPLQG